MLQIGKTVYREGLHKPERGAEHNWHVYCNTGALLVLTQDEHQKWFKAHANEPFSINFGNNSAADIKPGDALWQMLDEIAKLYLVEVFQPTLQGGYVGWSGAPGDLGCFDAIKITQKT